MVPRCDKFLIICGDIVETEFKNFYDNFLGYKIQNAAPLSEAAGELKYILKSNDNFNEVNITYSNGNPVISTNHKDKGQCNIFFLNGLVDKSTELISTFLKLDSRVQDVIVVVKKWMTLTNFISSDKLSGYAVTWMVLFYLMQDENPIIPPVIVLRTNIDANNKTFITENQLVVLLLDMFMAGAETTSSTLSFAVLYMLHYPDVQKHAQSELDITVGKGNQPVMQHLSRLSYIEAIIMEVQRICNIAPITAAHRAKSDTKVSGYIIPKDTTVLASIYSVHMDNEHWGDPENFRPERFINNEGKIIQDEWFIPFSLGKRRCLGETLARGSWFLFFSTILHNFIISSPPAEPLPSLEQIDGATLCPLPFYAVFTPRF
ncbi:methyl farnesoate epoxidase-like [Lycorma delicatula]|uniref:methyl farnesoate epoxidase-like n=1 Tax=Lycorma delicatula TaxID=130591 RepID=UPI003F50E58D